MLYQIVIYFLIKAWFWPMCLCSKDTHFDQVTIAFCPSENIISLTDAVKKEPWEEKRNTNKQTKASGYWNVSHWVGKNIDDPFVQMKTACKRKDTPWDMWVLHLCSKEPSFMLNICYKWGWWCGSVAFCCCC